jgi:hypothetical protein
MVKNVCRERPPMVTNAAYIRALQRIEFKNELNMTSSETVTTFTVATYVCATGLAFSNLRNTGSRYFGTQMLPYKNSTCVGPDKWDELPVCN